MPQVPSLPYVHNVMYSAPHGGGSGGGLSWKKSHSAGEKKLYGGCDACRGVTGCLDVLLEALLPLFGALVVDFLVTFDGSGSGLWYSGLRLSHTDDEVPIGDVFMFHKFGLTAGESGKLREVSSSQSLAFLTAVVVFYLLRFSAALSWLLNFFCQAHVRE